MGPAQAYFWILLGHVGENGVSCRQWSGVKGGVTHEK